MNEFTKIIKLINEIIILNYDFRIFWLNLIIILVVDLSIFKYK